jgi:uncharacterized protein (DUF2252 family)
MPRAAATGHPSVDDRAAYGKAARSDTPRSAHATWERAPGTPDPVTILTEQARTRLPELVPIRHGRMAASPFAFFRGAAAIMAADLASTPATGLRVQACGDAHLANFGVFAAPDRRLVFDINDFDETLRAPWEWDVKRLAASLAVVGRERGLDARSRRGIVTSAVTAYRTTMRELAGKRDLDVWYARAEVEPLLDLIRNQAPAAAIARTEGRLQRARRKDSLRALRKLTVADADADGDPRLAADPPLLVPVRDLAPELGGEALEDGMRELMRTYRASLRADLRHLMVGYRFVDLARKVVGVGSVGTRAWVILLLGRDRADPLFLQAKEAEASVLEPFAGRSPYRHHGRRVVEGQRLMQAAGDVLLGWVRTTGIDGRERDFYVRQLWDAKASADVEQMAPPALRIFGRLCGATLARAHARSGDRVAIAAYLGSGPRFDQSLAEFAELYADQNERDHRALADAVADGRVEAISGV